MLTQKQWKTQNLAGHLLSTATSAAAEAAHLSVLRQPMVREHSIVAEEARSIAKQIMMALEKNIFGGISGSEYNPLILDLSKRCAFLALNAGLLACKVHEHKPLAVFAEELRATSLELGELCGYIQKSSDIPAVLSRNKVIPDVFYLFSAKSGKYSWVENAHFVVEVLNYCPQFIHNNRLVISNNLRDMDMPYITMGDMPEDPGIVIISDAIDRKKHYAVLAEFGLHSLANSRVGVSHPCSADIPVRECWLASDGSEMIFPDWEQLALMG